MSPERTTDVFFALAAAGAWMAIAAAWVLDHAVAIGAAALVVGGWWTAMRRAERTVQRILADTQPGSDDGLLAACRDIYDPTHELRDNTGEENPQP